MEFIISIIDDGSNGNNILKLTLGKKYPGKIYSDEIGLPIKNSNLILPCGIVTRYEK